MPPNAVATPWGSLGISADRKWAVFMGNDGSQSTCYSWMLDLQTGKVRDLPGDPPSGIPVPGPFW